MTDLELRELVDRSIARARDDHLVDDDRHIWDFLDSRGISEAFAEEPDLFGIAPLSDARLLHGCRILVPLFDATGGLASAQARYAGNPPHGHLKVSTVARRPLRHTGFMNHAARLAVTGKPARALVVEGITDFLAACAAVPEIPVFGLAGAGNRDLVADLAGWRLIIATDRDQAGDEAAQFIADRIIAGGGSARRFRVSEENGKDLCDYVNRHGLKPLRVELNRVAS